MSAGSSKEGMTPAPGNFEAVPDETLPAEDNVSLRLAREIGLPRLLLELPRDAPRECPGIVGAVRDFTDQLETEWPEMFDRFRSAIKRRRGPPLVVDRRETGVRGQEDLLVRPARGKPR